MIRRLALAIALVLVTAAAAVAQTPAPTPPEGRWFSLEEYARLWDQQAAIPLLQERVNGDNAELKKREQQYQLGQNLVLLKDIELAAVYRIAIAYCHLYGLEQTSGHKKARSDGIDKWASVLAALGTIALPYGPLAGGAVGVAVGYFSAGSAPTPPDCGELKKLLGDVGKAPSAPSTPTASAATTFPSPPPGGPQGP